MNVWSSISLQGDHMLQEKYTLEVISHHPKFKSKTLKKYAVDGINTVGAWGDEPFELKFTNNTFNKVQVRISVDGTDILTALPASTRTAGSMWVVNGKDTLSLKAWPENSKSGASFVFTSAKNSVALHTHGDLSNRGILAAAVFEEGYVEPVRVMPVEICEKPTIGGRRDTKGAESETYNSSYDYSLYDSIGPAHESMSFNRADDDSVVPCSAQVPTKSDHRLQSRRSRELKSLVAVGAGKQVKQEITYVSGLKKPVLAETIRVKYLWWDELKAKLKDQKPEDLHPSGFPADKPYKIMSLGNTPRVDYEPKNVRCGGLGKVPQEYSRF